MVLTNLSNILTVSCPSLKYALLHNPIIRDNAFHVGVGSYYNYELYYIIIWNLLF